MRLIDGGRLPIDYCKANCGKLPGNLEVCPNCHGAQMIADAPAIDPKSLRPTAEWVSVYGGEWVKCSECNSHWQSGIVEHCNVNYCPNCGANMKGGAKNG